MRVLGVGVDIVETQRIEHSLERFGDRFLHRIFTEGKIAYCRSMKYPAGHFAARFTAKEAVSKTALASAKRWVGATRYSSSWERQPFVMLEGGAKQLAAERGVSGVWVSLSHTDDHAVATVVMGK